MAKHRQTNIILLDEKGLKPPATRDRGQRQEMRNVPFPCPMVAFLGIDRRVKSRLTKAFLV